ncbi:hypothetical protein [Nostoc sp. 'Peltigera malacea cyanobiont' DB3992]|uniref:hypothetical protein n=1 Tax=Nostoc sp. 'Peltigera malacea cyanobiont' DB3992 TaxID=1206980 RepID=UPI00211E480B|nr:hypothetical protein [Nostoc sp. 'Peltigera malacea cyanobiont' DB3992]
MSDFYENHPYRQNLRDLLIGLNVRDIEKNSSATVVDIEGTIGEREEELLKYKPASISEISIREAPRDQPVVVVEFGKNKKRYLYAMAALIPCITEETAERFDVTYGDLLKEAKIPYQQRQTTLASYKQEAALALNIYGFELSEKCLNSTKSSNCAELFLPIKFKLEDTQLLFGKEKSKQNFVGRRGDILKGLLKGGVYRRQFKYQDKLTEIRITALKLCDFKVDPFIREVQKRLESYGFKSIVVHKVPLSVGRSSVPEDREKVEEAVDKLMAVPEDREKIKEAVNELMAIPTDIVLTFLPQSDRHADNSDDGSFYSFIYSRLLRREIASQVIYEDTLKNSSNYGNILNQVIPGILAKLGNLPLF